MDFIPSLESGATILKQNIMSRFECQISTGEIGWERSRDVQQMDRLETNWVRRSWEPQEEEAQRGLINTYKYRMRGGNEDGARLYTVVPSDRMRGGGHKLKERKLHLSVMKKLVKVVKCQNRVLREPAESACSEIFETQQSWPTCSSWPCVRRGLD